MVAKMIEQMDSGVLLAILGFTVCISAFGIWIINRMSKL
jgi:hypothetical protein